MTRVALFAAMLAVAATAHAERFTYHGTLQDGGQLAEGRYDLQLTLYPAAQGGAPLAAPTRLYGVEVPAGNFSTDVDFGPLSALDAPAWLEVDVKPAGGGDYAKLDTRSPVSPDTNSCPGAWSLDGNAGNPAGSYIGTADGQDVVIKANGYTVFNALGSLHAAVALSGSNSSGAGAFSTSLAEAYAAKGDASISGGYAAGAINNGSIVWGDFPSTPHEINDSAPNQFIVQANGGVGINTSHKEGGVNPLDATLTVGLPSMATGSGLASIKIRGVETATESVTLGGVANLLGTGYPVLGITSHNNDGSDYQNASFSHNKVHFNGGGAATGALSVGSDGTNGNGAYLTVGGVWTNASSRTFKDGFAAVDVEGVLGKLVAMPVQTWFYTQAHAEGLHMGPVAEDFAASFGLGNDDKHVGTVDESGVAFAAIQGLNRKVETENAGLRRENAELRDRFDQLAARLARIERSQGE